MVSDVHCVRLVSLALPVLLLCLVWRACDICHCQCDIDSKHSICSHYVCSYYSRKFDVCNKKSSMCTSDSRVLTATGLVSGDC